MKQALIRWPETKWKPCYYIADDELAKDIDETYQLMEFSVIKTPLYIKMSEQKIKLLH